MHIGNSHKCEIPKDSETTLGIYNILGKREKEGKEVLHFESEIGQFTGS